jgi:hypothetical protein
VIASSRPLWTTTSGGTAESRRCDDLTKKDGDAPLFPSFKKRELKKGKMLIRKVHKRVVAPPGE